jgi:hypothetical protein
MGFREKVRQELKAVALTTIYFATWLCVLIILKELVLAEYQIEVRGFSMALIGALVIAKVVLVMEHVPLGSWLCRRPAVLDVIVRTVLYGIGVFVVLLLEKTFEARHEYDGFAAALAQVFAHRDMPHVWANTICVISALLWFNAFSLVRRHLGEQAVIRILLEPPPDEPGARPRDLNSRQRAKNAKGGVERETG